VEAADDICYTIIDFEDGINLGLIEEEFALEYLIKLVKGNINTQNYNKLTKTSDRLAYLRALAISTLIAEAADIFIENEQAILNGEFSTALLDKSKYQAQIKYILKISIEKIYQSTEVTDKEIAGYAILNKLLDVFTRSIENANNNTTNHYDRLILKNLSKDLPENGTIYEILLEGCNYISRLTDGNALLKFQKIGGNL